MGTTVRPFTAEELLLMPDDGFRYELIKGELIKMSPPGAKHGGVTTRVTVRLDQHVRANELGAVLTGDAGFQLASKPDTVLAPDVAFVRRDRLPPEGLPTAYWPGAPDLAVEVLSPNDSAKEASEKAERWIAAGTLMVWTLNPRVRTVTVRRPGSEPVILGETDTLDGLDVVPGFRCRVAELFD